MHKQLWYILTMKYKYLPQKEIGWQGLVVHAYNPSTEEAEAGGFQTQGQPGLYSNLLSQKTNEKNTIGCQYLQQHA
jgi:hypothetical protein